MLTSALLSLTLPLLTTAIPANNPIDTKRPSGYTHCTEPFFKGNCTYGYSHNTDFNQCLRPDNNGGAWKGSFTVSPWTACTLFQDPTCKDDVVVHTVRLGGDSKRTLLQDLSAQVVESNVTKGPWRGFICVKSDKYRAT